MKLSSISPLTIGQEETYDAYNEGKNLVLTGVAGTGKTFLTMFLALNEIAGSNRKSGSPTKLVIVRSSVSSRDPGFLPGSAKEKHAIYEPPYQAILSELYQRGDAWDILTKNGTIEFTSTAYLRGSTIDNAIILVDEFQNMTFQELDTVITRVGKNSKIIFCGDYNQNDLVNKRFEQSGFGRFLDILELMEDDFEIIDFTIEDIVRSGLVKNYIIAKEEKNKHY